MIAEEKILPKLEKVRRTGAGIWSACCPSHADKSPSLGVRELDDGRVLLHCRAGCSVGEVCGAMGLELQDLFPPKPIDHARPVRRSFPAADVLETLSTEALIVLMTARNMLNGVPMVEAQYERLSLAVERIERGREVANG
jgi:hypothetical protein